ncbi:MAG: hypothetical protein ACAF41_23365 [Leptolyngbya sp. BL-A-14]
MLSQRLDQYLVRYSYWKSATQLAVHDRAHYPTLSSEFTQVNSEPLSNPLATLQPGEPLAKTSVSGQAGV